MSNIITALPPTNASNQTHMHTTWLLCGRIRLIHVLFSLYYSVRSHYLTYTRSSIQSGLNGEHVPSQKSRRSGEMQQRAPELISIVKFNLSSTRNVLENSDSFSILLINPLVGIEPFSAVIILKC